MADPAKAGQENTDPGTQQTPEQIAAASAAAAQTPEQKAAADAAASAAVQTPDQLHDAAIAATEAWQADPSKPELKAAAQEAVKKAKDAIAAEKTAKETAAAANKAPEKYDLKLPENSLLSEGDLVKIAAVAKERGLTNEAAQKLVEERNQVISEYKTTQETQVGEMQKSWLSTAQNDKEYGGADYGKNAELAKRVLAKYGTPEFNAVLSDPKKGLFGNHPELVRVFVRIGKSMSEDQLILSKAQGGSDGKSFADKFYGDVQK